MASMTRRMNRMMNCTSKHVPLFTERELAKLDGPTREQLTQRIAEVQADQPESTDVAAAEELIAAVEEAIAEKKAPEAHKDLAPEAEVSACPVHNGSKSPSGVQGTVFTPKNAKIGGPFGPFKNQGVAKLAIRAHLNVARMPAGDFARV